MGKPKQLPFPLNSGLEQQAIVRGLVSSAQKGRMRRLCVCTELSSCAMLWEANSVVPGCILSNRGKHEQKGVCLAFLFQFCQPTRD